MQIFSGSYLAEDVQFLLQPIELQMTDINEKEALIQSGAVHYSQMLSQEPAPSDAHMAIFHQALAAHEKRLAEEVVSLAKTLMTHFGDKPIVLASLVRAGVPLGILLRRALKAMGKTAFHYGISIVRDRGLDEVAMRYIEAKHDKASIVFVDGWTGKGAISRQLTQSLSARGGYPSMPQLVVLADPYGAAWLSASQQDWLIPFGILGAPISGLVSRSVWSADTLHGCVLCEHLRQWDISRQFVDSLSALFFLHQDTQILEFANAELPVSTQSADAIISQLQHQFRVDNINRIKPGIAEATRAVLRRVPERVLVRDNQDADVRLLLLLAEKKGVEVLPLGEMLGPYRAVTIIKKVH